MLILHETRRSLPIAYLGVQALFVIIENVIRNSAKHSKGNANVHISWNHDVNQLSDFVKLTIYDKNDQKKVDELNELVQKQNDRIGKEILENGILRHGSWGMLEMKIASAYLRKIPVEKIDEKHDIPLLKAVTVPEDNGKYLGYTFYLLKPKRVLIIPDNTIDINLPPDYEQDGIFIKRLNDIEISSDTYSHEIVILVNHKRFAPKNSVDN